MLLELARWLEQLQSLFGLFNYLTFRGILSALTALAFAAWTTFGILKGEWTLIIPNAICLCFALFILGMIALPQRKTEEVAEALDPVE